MADKTIGGEGQSIENISTLTFHCDDLDKTISIKDYLKQLLLTLWDEQEGFSGKRPFGNSGWDYDIMACLVKHKVIDGEIGTDGYLADCDYSAGDDIVRQIIENM